MGDTLDLENSMYSQYLINRTVGSKKSAQIYFGRYIMKSPDWIFSTPGNERKKTKIFKNILEFFFFPIVLRGRGYVRFRKLDVFAIFNQSDCGFKKNCSDNIFLFFLLHVIFFNQKILSENFIDVQNFEDNFLWSPSDFFSDIHFLYSYT